MFIAIHFQNFEKIISSHLKIFLNHFIVLCTHQLVVCQNESTIKHKQRIVIEINLAFEKIILYYCVCRRQLSFWSSGTCGYWLYNKLLFHKTRGRPVLPFTFLTLRANVLCKGPARKICNASNTSWSTFRKCFATNSLHDLPITQWLRYNGLQRLLMMWCLLYRSSRTIHCKTVWISKQIWMSYNPKHKNGESKSTKTSLNT